MRSKTTVEVCVTNTLLSSYNPFFTYVIIAKWVIPSHESWRLQLLTNHQRWPMDALLRLTLHFSSAVLLKLYALIADKSLEVITTLTIVARNAILTGLTIVWNTHVMTNEHIWHSCLTSARTFCFSILPICSDIRFHAATRSTADVLRNGYAEEIDAQSVRRVDRLHRSENVRYAAKNKGSLRVDTLNELKTKWHSKICRLFAWVYACFLCNARCHGSGWSLLMAQWSF